MSNPNESSLLNQDESDFEKQMEEAQALFTNTALTSKMLTDSPLVYENNKVLFIILTPEENRHPRAVSEMKSYLKSFISIVADYVNRQADGRGSDNATDINLWQKAISALPLIAPSNVDQSTYKKNTPGIEIIPELFALFAQHGNQEHNDFKEYMQRQTGGVKHGIATSSTVKMIISLLIIEKVNIGDEEMYTPKIKFYKVDLNSGNTKWIDGCNKSEAFAIDLNYSYTSNTFDFNALNRGSTKRKVDDFISRTRGMKIDGNDNFFEGRYRS